MRQPANRIKKLTLLVILLCATLVTLLSSEARALTSYSGIIDGYLHFDTVAEELYYTARSGGQATSSVSVYGNADAYAPAPEVWSYTGRVLDYSAPETYIWLNFGNDDIGGWVA